MLTVNEMNKRKYLVIILILAGFLLGYYGGLTKAENKMTAGPKEPGQVYNTNDIPDYLTKDVNFNLFWNVWDIVRKNYADQPVSETELFYGALSGLVDSLGDPYSNFLDPETLEAFQQELEGSFQGIGAEIGIKQDVLTIIAPLPDTPAERAGLQPGDKILAIDQMETIDMSLDQAVHLIRGPKGTTVTLTIFRDGFEEVKDIDIVRDEIIVKSVTWEFKDNNIAYIKISHFNADTKTLFKRAISELLEIKSDKIILDLRNNPGGFLETSVDIASFWIEDGVVVSEKERDENIREYQARGAALLKNTRTVILINEGSASASEIVSGALKDYGLATLVGMKTFGKGSVQELIPLDDGSAIKITVAKWLTPNGLDITEEGISPDIEIDFTDEDYENDRDPQLDKAIELLVNQ